MMQLFFIMINWHHRTTAIMELADYLDCLSLNKLR